MSEQFTPGPWYLDGGFVYAERNRAIKAKNRNSSDGNIPLAKIIADFAGEQQANARLIAASPTMADYIQRKADEGDEEAARIMEIIHARS